MDFLGFNRPKARDIARERLKLVLIHDRSNCSPQMLEMLKDDILKVISNYLEIDEDDMEVQISQEGTDDGVVPMLLANIPIKGVKKAAML